MILRFALVLTLALVATASWAQKPIERSALEIGHDYVETVSRTHANMFTSDVDGTPRVLSALNYSVNPGTPEAMAEQYLADNAATLRAVGSEYEHQSTRSGRAGHTVRFRQTIEGVPVWFPETVVNIDNQNRVQFVINEIRSDIFVQSIVPAIDEATARQIAFDYLAVSGELLTDETTLIVYPPLEYARLAWSVRVVPGSPVGDWEAIVDANTGEIVRVKDHSVSHHGDDGIDRDDPPSFAPTAASHRTPARVDGTGYIFDPDPLTRAGATYGDPGYVDGNDADTPELTAARSMVTMRDITFDGANYKLEGPYAEIMDFESPFFGLFEQPSDTWDFTRLAPDFEAANVYWQIDNYMRYINETLGIAVTPRQYSGGVRFDPHGLNGADNSHYTGGRVAFGEGCVDDSEDADVIIHELGHGIHDWLAGAISNGDGLSEGIGDYVAVEYTRSLGLLSPSDPEYNWVFKWDGHNPCWPGRITNYTANYPTGSAPHQRGQHWSTSNLKIWEDLGREATNSAMFEGLVMTNGGSTQPVAAQAVMQAAANMGYSQADLTTMLTHYVDQGYTVTIPTASESGPGNEQPNGFELTAAYPNPFNPAANFTLRVAAAQYVDIALYDAIGRQVQSIFAGPMAAGQRRVFTIDARNLPSGLYVYRAVGEGFAESRNVVLNK